jgi:hypothetical protein
MTEALHTSSFMADCLSPEYAERLLAEALDGQQPPHEDDNFNPVPIPKGPRSQNGQGAAALSDENESLMELVASNPGNKH